MVLDISASGVSARVIASKSFPNGFTITEWADDADPFDPATTDIADTSMDINGTLLSFSTPRPTELTLNLIPNSEADKNMSVLFHNNLPARGKVVAQDEITIVAIYPDGETTTYSNGRLKSGVAGSSPSSEGRKKTKTYVFSFGQVS